MELEVKDYLCQPRNSKREREFANILRGIPEEQRYSIVRDVLRQDKGLGLSIANATLRNKRYFQEIFEMGLNEGDASTILPWLECTVPKLGFRSVILSLNNRLVTNPQAVDNALYWMPRFKPENDLKSDSLLANIKAKRQNVSNE